MSVNELKQLSGLSQADYSATYGVLMGNAKSRLSEAEYARVERAAVNAAKRRRPLLLPFGADVALGRRLGPVYTFAVVAGVVVRQTTLGHQRVLDGGAHNYRVMVEAGRMLSREGLDWLLSNDQVAADWLAIMAQESGNALVEAVTGRATLEAATASAVAAAASEELVGRSEDITERPECAAEANGNSEAITLVEGEDDGCGEPPTQAGDKIVQSSQTKKVKREGWRFVTWLKESVAAGLIVPNEEGGVLYTDVQRRVLIQFMQAFELYAEATGNEVRNSVNQFRRLRIHHPGKAHGTSHEVLLTTGETIHCLMLADAGVVFENGAPKGQALVMKPKKGKKEAAA